MAFFSNANLHFLTSYHQKLWNSCKPIFFYCKWSTQLLIHSGHSGFFPSLIAERMSDATETLFCWHKRIWLNIVENYKSNLSRSHIVIWYRNKNWAKRNWTAQFEKLLMQFMVLYGLDLNAINILTPSPETDRFSLLHSWLFCPLVFFSPFKLKCIEIFMVKSESHHYDFWRKIRKKEAKSGRLFDRFNCVTICVLWILNNEFSNGGLFIGRISYDDFVGIKNLNTLLKECWISFTHI